MRRLILHIGLEKTGTKALQGFLDRHRTALRLMGVRYPRCKTPEGDAVPYHRDLGDALNAAARGAAQTDWGPVDQVIEGYAEKAEGASITVLSNETLSAPHPGIAAALAPLGGRFAVTVVVYLRRQDEWALSAYRQAVVGTAAEARPISTWLEDPVTRARLDYAARLRPWEEAFGEDALRVRLYPHHLPLVPDFLTVAELPSAAALLPDRTRRVNESVPEEEVTAALAANGGVPVAPHLDQPARDALLAAFAGGNHVIRQRYFPDRRTLFGVD